QAHFSQNGDAIAIQGKFLKSGNIKLVFDANGQEKIQVITVSDVKIQHGTMASRLWARSQAEQWSIDIPKNHQSIVALGVEFGIVTNATSMLVLENINQYLEYGVRPADTLVKLQKKYDLEVEEYQQEQKEMLAEDQADKVDEMVDMWNDRCEWWQKEHQLPEDWKIPANDGGALFGAEGGGSLFSDSGSMLAEIGGEEDADFDGAGQPEGSGISVTPWKPDRPYLDILNSLAADEIHLAYYVLSRSYRGSPSFYLDCASWFKQREDHVYAMRALSNLAELRIEDPRLMRMYAWKLLEFAEFDRAISVLQRVRRLRPDDPQSYRHLALAYIARYEHNPNISDATIASDLLYAVISRYWERFEGIEMVSLMELNNLIAAVRRHKIFHKKI
ncbi:MAG: hypothetical protein HRU15_19680, partial [Planctomycetes bacterium]|nr:hypothetical protein [Planctomycetota bacterium]